MEGPSLAPGDVFASDRFGLSTVIACEPARLESVAADSDYGYMAPKRRCQQCLLLVPSGGHLVWWDVWFDADIAAGMKFVLRA